MRDDMIAGYRVDGAAGFSAVSTIWLHRETLAANGLPFGRLVPLAILRGCG
jgi:hypothetical protein